MIPRKLLEIARSTDNRSLAAGAIGGLSGQLVFATTQIACHLSGPAGQLAASAQGVEWGRHLLGSLVLGVGFAVFVSNTSIGTDAPAKSAALGLGYGVLVWVVPLPAILALGAEMLGVSNVPSVETLDPGSFGRHAVYGLVVGIVFPLLRDSDGLAVVEG